MNDVKWTSGSLEGRWGKLGPYYAMFPVDFVRSTVNCLTKPGQGVLDPFCGRGTVPFVAKVTGRPSLGIDVNPVAWVYSSTKVNPEPDSNSILKRIKEIAASINSEDDKPENEFQEWAWSPNVLAFLRAARRELQWQSNRKDRTIAAIILVYLHAKIGNGLSNQMRQSKAMAPDYSVRWWKEKKQRPPIIDPVAYLCDRVLWRYQKGIPITETPSDIILGDARQVLLDNSTKKFQLLLTSPPYSGVTDYRTDNWIRLWLLGGPSLPQYKNPQRFSDRGMYRQMLFDVFKAAREALTEDAVLLVRTDTREFTRDITAAILRFLWPDHQLYSKSEAPKRTQTHLFGDNELKPGETDLLLLPTGDRRGLPGFNPVAPEEMASEKFA